MLKTSKISIWKETAWTIQSSDKKLAMQKNEFNSLINGTRKEKTWSSKILCDVLLSELNSNNLMLSTIKTAMKHFWSGNLWVLYSN